MRIMVTEMPISDALTRARTRFEQLDRRMASAYECFDPSAAFILAGVVSVAGGLATALGVFPVAPNLAMAVAILLLVSGGGLLGHGLPLWCRARTDIKRLEQRWNHALGNLRFRESQAAEDPELTVEVLSHVNGQDLLVTPQNRRPRRLGGAPTGQYRQ